MLLKDTDPYIRFADAVEYNISRGLTKTYDSRLIYILSGSGEIYIEEQLHKLSEGMLINFQPGTPYAINPLPCFHAIAIDYDLTCDHQDETSVFPPIPIDSFCEEKSHGRITFKDTTMFNEALMIKNAFYTRRYISELAEEFNSGKPYFREKSALILKKMMFEIAGNYKNNGKKNQICDYVTSYIIRNYQDNISNVQLAKMLNLDSGYLNKVFKASTGKTIHKALLEQRINAASKMLLTTNASLEKIAYETGFYNPAHFSAMFKKMTGHSPSYYRKGK